MYFLEVFYYAVVNERGFADDMRVRVALAGLSVRCPARVSDSAGAFRGVERPHFFFKARNLPTAFYNCKTFVIEKRHSCGVIAPVLQSI